MWFLRGPACWRGSVKKAQFVPLFWASLVKALARIPRAAICPGSDCPAKLGEDA